MTVGPLAALDVPDPHGKLQDRAAFFAALDDLATQVRYRAMNNARISVRFSAQGQAHPNWWAICVNGYPLISGVGASDIPAARSALCAGEIDWGDHQQFGEVSGE